jgi:hypothetical protein
MTRICTWLALALCALAPVTSAQAATAYGATVNISTPTVIPGARMATDITTSTAGVRLDISVRVTRITLGRRTVVRTVTYQISRVRRQTASRVTYAIGCPLSPDSRYSATAAVRVYNRAGRVLGTFTAASGTSPEIGCR